IADLTPGLSENDVSSSIIKMWSKKYNLQPETADQTLKAVTLNDDEAEVLNKKAGDPSILRESTGYLDDEKPLWFERTIFSGQDYIYRFKINLSSMIPKVENIYIGDSESETDS
ncbi:MAG: UTRA domain-containing protein, partial [Proteobacteria bacterium]|nr:UTRA domain-containing protein [Pseudomonadota bacterium]